MRIKNDVEPECGEVASGGGHGRVVTRDEAIGGVIDGGLEIEESSVAAWSAHSGANDERVGIAFFKAVEARDEKHVGTVETLCAGEIGVGRAVEAGRARSTFRSEFGIHAGPAA